MTIHYGTDGSVVCSKSFWRARAAYAVIDENAGKVHHWSISSYTAGLFAILVAFAAASGPCVIHTDSLTIVQQYQRLLQCDQLPLTLQHYAWWKFLFKLIRERQHEPSEALHLVWCPAHNWDHLPIECIADEMLRAKSLSRVDLINNRKADFVAELLEGYSTRCTASLARELCEIRRHHLWLAQLRKYLSDDTSNRVLKNQPNAEAEHPVYSGRTDHKELYPRWDWNADITNFPVPSPPVHDDFSGYNGPFMPATGLPL